jgi:hypothetical protein
MKARVLWVALLVAALFPVLGSSVAQAQMPKPGVKGYEVEWVYRVRYGYIDEWWDIFRKYEVPVLDRLKEMGYLLDYRIYHPVQHTDEAARWDYRVELTWRDFEASHHEEEVAQKLFPDAAARKQADRRRWEMTTNHWDLPIYQVDGTKSR